VPVFRAPVGTPMMRRRVVCPRNHPAPPSFSPGLFARSVSPVVFARSGTRLCPATGVLIIAVCVRATSGVTGPRDG